MTGSARGEKLNKQLNKESKERTCSHEGRRRGEESAGNREKDEQTGCLEGIEIPALVTPLIGETGTHWRAHAHSTGSS